MEDEGRNGLRFGCQSRSAEFIESSAGESKTVCPALPRLGATINLAFMFFDNNIMRYGQALSDSLVL